MPPRPRFVPASPRPDAANRRLHIHGIDEMPAGYDAEVAELFRDLRAASALSETDLAARLGTRADVVQALEQGALYALPAWAETCRVVNAYGALLNLDVRPLLRRIYAQLEAGIVELRPKAMPDVPVMTPPDHSDFAFSPDNSFKPDKQAAPAGRSPLDIEWTPDPVPARPQSRPQPPSSPKPQSPQAPWQNASQAPQAWPKGPVSPSPQAPSPQAPWPGAAPQRQAAPAPQQVERRPQPRPAQGQPTQGPAPQGRGPQGQPPPRPAPAQQPQPLRQAPPPPPPKPRAEFTAPPPPPPPPSATPRAIQDAAMDEPPAVEEKPKRKSLLLKWGVIALLIAIMAFGAWLVLNSMNSQSGVKAPSTGSQSLDPDDPRSRKADKLQGPS